MCFIIFLMKFLWSHLFKEVLPHQSSTISFYDTATIEPVYTSSVIMWLVHLYTYTCETYSISPKLISRHPSDNIRKSWVERVSSGNKGFHISKNRCYFSLFIVPSTKDKPRYRNCEPQSGAFFVCPKPLFTRVNLPFYKSRAIRFLRITGIPSI